MLCRVQRGLHGEVAPRDATHPRERECPKPDSSWRHQMEVCNPHDCVGDEICIARQDLILAIDGSGSVQDSGFGVLKDFALKLVDKYQGMYYGYADMKIGIILFGNGEIMDDG